MSYRSLALAVAAFSSIQVASADAQSVYVAPGGVYIGGGPVYVIPAPNNGAAPYVAPTYGYEYGPPAVVAPAPAVVAPTTVCRGRAWPYPIPATVVVPLAMVTAPAIELKQAWRATRRSGGQPILTLHVRSRYLHGDPDNVIAFAMVCCRA
jgi:hypothetical protein